MGSMLNIIAMHRVQAAREEMGNMPGDYAESDKVMNAYKDRFGSDALRELYAAKGHDFRATVEAAREIMAGNKFGMVSGGARGPLSMTTSVGQGD